MAEANPFSGIGRLASGKAPPHSIDAEEGLLASCMLDASQDIMTACLEARLSPDSFYKPAHQVIFQVMLDLYNKQQPIEEVSLFNALQSRVLKSIPWLREKQKETYQDTPLLELIGGPKIVSDITNRIETTAHAKHWIEIVREKWMLRRLITTTTKISEQAYVNQDQLSHFIDSVEQQVLSINEDRIQTSAQKFEDAVDSATQLISKILEGKYEGGVPTGYTDLDKMTFGLHGGQMIVLAARPSMGKTSLGMNIAENVAVPVRGEAAGVLVFSLEMPSEQLAMRMMCGRAKVSMKRVRERMIGREQMKQLVSASKDLRESPIWVDDSSGLNILELRAKARRMHKQEKIGLIVIDYLQLIAGTDNRVPREQQIAEISRGIKGLAKDLNVPVLVLSQLNRASDKENRDPRISDLRESGSIEQDADVIFLLAPGKKADDNPDIPQASRERKVIVAKQRNGQTGAVRMTFIPDYTRFENYSDQESE